MDNNNPNYQTWHMSQKFQESIGNFARNYAQPPEMTDAQSWNYRIIDVIKQKLQQRSILFTPEYVGSVYEGLKVTGGPVKRDDIEFDVMIMWDLNDPVETETTGLPNYKLVKFLTQSPTMQRMANGNGYLLPNLVANDFFGKIQTCVNEMNYLQQNDLKIILRKHGPAIQMDVHRLHSGLLFYSVDIVPAIKIGNEYYVAKELKLNVGNRVAPDLKPLTWRRSYSLNEREKILHLGFQNENRRMLLKVLKAIRNADNTLAFLTSYHLKNVLLNVCDRLSDPSQWSDEHRGERLIDLVKELEVSLENRNLPCNFQQDVNLFDGMSDVALQNLKNRCKRMVSSEILMNQLLRASI